METRSQYILHPFSTVVNTECMRIVFTDPYYISIYCLCCTVSQKRAFGLKNITTVFKFIRCPSITLYVFHILAYVNMYYWCLFNQPICLLPVQRVLLILPARNLSEWTTIQINVTGIDKYNNVLCILYLGKEVDNLSLSVLTIWH